MTSTSTNRRTTNKSNKSASAFRTISEVSEELEVPQHVLRFWETKFGQVRPMKRGGGRRYYRPEDIVLLRRIRDLLYHDGYTIKGVQKLLREGGRVRLVRSESDEKEAQASEPATKVGSEENRRELVELLKELEALRDILRKL